MAPGSIIDPSPTQTIVVLVLFILLECNNHTGNCNAFTTKRSRLTKQRLPPLLPRHTASALYEFSLLLFAERNYVPATGAPTTLQVVEGCIQQGNKRGTGDEHSRLTE